MVMVINMLTQVYVTESKTLRSHPAQWEEKLNHQNNMGSTQRDRLNKTEAQKNRRQSNMIFLITNFNF